MQRLIELIKTLLNSGIQMLVESWEADKVRTILSVGSFLCAVAILVLLVQIILLTIEAQQIARDIRIINGLQNLFSDKRGRGK